MKANPSIPRCWSSNYNERNLNNIDIRIRIEGIFESLNNCDRRAINALHGDGLVDDDAVGQRAINRPPASLVDAVGHPDLIASEEAPTAL